MNEFRRLWSRFPDKASATMPQYYEKTPRLDAVRAISEHCSIQELNFFKKTDYLKNGKNAEKIINDDLINVLENPVPNFPEIDGYSLRYFTFAQLELVGECAWVKIRENGKIKGLLPILKSWILEKPTISNNTYLIRPYGELGGKVLRLEPKDVVFFKDIDINDPYGNGKGLAESIADEIETDEYASKYQKNFFYNDATPPFVITGFQGGEQQAEKVKKTFMQKMAGFLHAKEPAVLTGSADVKTIGLAPRELDMVESRKYLRNECLQHFRLPPEIMGIIENSNRSTIDASFYLMQKNVLPTRLARFERTLNRQLLPDFDKDLICKHDFSCDEDLEFKFKVYSFGLNNGTITREEFRNAFGLEPEIKDGTLIMPIMNNVVNAGEVNLDEIQGEEVELPEDTDEGKTLNIIPQKDERQAIRIKAWEMFDKSATSGEDNFIKSCRKIADRQEKDIAELLKGWNEKSQVENIINGYFTKEVDGKVKSTFANAWLQSMIKGRDNAHRLMNKKSVDEITDTYLTNEMFNKWIETEGLKKSVMINDTTKKELIKKLRSILAMEDVNEIPMSQLSKRLVEGSKEVFDELSKSRAMLIARTETGTTVNYGQFQTYKANGYQKKQWIATYDNRTRDSHLLVSEQVVGIEESFDVGGEELQYPLDPNGSAENVCNCRCSIISLE